MSICVFCGDETVFVDEICPDCVNDKIDTMQRFYAKKDVNIPYIKENMNEFLTYEKRLRNIRIARAARRNK